MKKALTFLWKQYIFQITVINLVLGLLILATNYLFPQQSMFAIYLMMYPLFSILFLVIYGFNLTSVWQNIALSFQCRRRDFYWASQVAFLATGLGIALVVVGMGWLYTNVLDLSVMAAGRTFLKHGLLWARPEIIPIMLVMAVGLQPVGAGLGRLYEAHKIISTVILMLIMLMGTLSTTATLFIGEWGLELGMPTLLGVCVVLTLMALVGEAYYYHSVQTAVVR